MAPTMRKRMDAFSKFSLCLFKGGTYKSWATLLNSYSSRFLWVIGMGCHMIILLYGKQFETSPLNLLADLEIDFLVSKRTCKAVVWNGSLFLHVGWTILWLHDTVWLYMHLYSKVNIRLYVWWYQRQLLCNLNQIFSCTFIQIFMGYYNLISPCFQFTSIIKRIKVM
jgi:hypothetical protein